jgi:hypothetical protein
MNVASAAAVVVLAAAALLLIARVPLEDIGGPSSPPAPPASRAAACTLGDAHCFDWSRCAGRDGVYVYIYKTSDEPWWSRLLMRLFADAEMSRRFDRRVAAALSARGARVKLVSDPARACLFVPRVGTCLSVNKCPLPTFLAQWRLRALPFWNGTGRNHVLLDHFDSAGASHLPRGASGAAMSMRSATSARHFRPGFDIALPLLGKMSAYRRVVMGGRGDKDGDIAGNASSRFAFAQRKVLVGFLGAPTTPPDGDRAGADSTVGVQGIRQLLRTLHEPASRVVVRVREPKCKVPCKRHAPEFRTEYMDVLLTSRFQLVPRGNGLHSHRLLESLSAGSIPIIVADGIVLPFSGIIPWNEAVVMLAESEWQSIPAVARRIEADPVSARSKQCAGLAIYRNFFMRPGGGSIGLAFRLLQSRVRSNPMFLGTAIVSRGAGVPGATTAQRQRRVLTAWPLGREPAMPKFCKGSKGWTVVELAAQRLTLAH